MVSVVDKVNASWKDLLEPWGGALDLNADAADHASTGRSTVSAFGIGTLLAASADANAESRLVSEGLQAIGGGHEGMERWARSMLAPRSERMGYDVNVMNEHNAPFSKGLVKRWEWLKNDVVAHMPLEARKAYEAVLNAQMRESLQETMFNDEAVEEYKAVKWREFDADGGHGREAKAELSDATRKKAEEFQRLKNEVDEKSPGGPLDTINRWAAIADGRPDPQADPARLALKSFESRNPGFVGFDLGSAQHYVGEKLDAAKRFAAQYAPELRTGITAALMGARYGQQWLVSELGYDFQSRTFAQLAGAAHPHADSVVKRWDHVKSNLARMPDFLQERFDKYANSALASTLHGAMKEDQKVGKYGDVKATLYSSKGGGEEYRFWLNSDQTLGYEKVPEEQDCITQVILPIVAAVLMIIPGTQGLGAVLGTMAFAGTAAGTAMFAVGAALNVGLAMNNAVETGDWLGAVGSVAGAAIGLGGVMGATGSLGSSLGGSVGGALGLSNGTISTLATGINVLNDTVVPIAKGAYGLYQGVEHGSPWAALAGVGGMMGAQGFGNMAHAGGAALQGVSALGSGIEYGNPFAIASGALTFGNLAGTAVADQVRPQPSLYDIVPDRGSGALVQTGFDLARAGNTLASQAYSAVNGGSIDAAAITQGVGPVNRDLADRDNEQLTQQTVTPYLDQLLPSLAPREA